MPFPSILSGGEITQVRRDTQSFEHYLLLTPNDIVWQAQVNDSKSNEVYASFAWQTTESGDSADVIAGQVVLITTSKTDLTDPVIRGRVRKEPDSGTFFINETDVTIDNTMFLTVLDDFDIVEKLPRLNAANVQFKDWDIAYQKLPPLIAGLQSAYVDFTGDNPITLSFAPTAAAISSGASISSWLWDVSDGTITVGSASTQNITATFPGESVNEHRWVHLTVTDSNGITADFHFQVFTVDKNSSNAVLLDAGDMTIDASIEDGWNTSITGWDNLTISSVLDQTRVVVAGIDTFDVEGTPVNTPIIANILMIGRMHNESNASEPNEEAGLIDEVEITIEGFATQLARLPFMPQQVLDDSTPTAWGDIADPDPVRIAAYILAYHSTYPTISAITIQDLSAFTIGDTNLSDTNVIENVIQIVDVVKAVVMYAPAGETTIQRNANYLSTSDRNALDTIYDFVEADYTSINSLNLEYGQTIGQAVTGAIVYNTTKNEVGQNWVARSPSQVFGEAYESVRTVNQVLTADSSQSAARTEIGQRIANDLAFVNPKPILDLSVMDGFRGVLIPTVHQWWTHTIAANKTARGRAYTSGDRWWLNSMSYTTNAEFNTSITSCQFIAETLSTNAGILPTLVPDVNALQLNFPPLSAYDFFVDDPLVNYPVDTPDIELPFEGLSITEPVPPGNNLDVGVGQDAFNVPFFNNDTISTKRTSTVGETYTVTAEGSAIIEATTEITIDFSTPGDYSFPDTTGNTDLAGFIMNPSSLDASPPAGSPSGGNAAKGGAVYDSGFGSSPNRKGAVAKNTNFSTPQTIVSVAVSGHRSSGVLPSGRNIAYLAQMYDSGGTQVGLLKLTVSLANNSWVTKTLTSSELFSGTMSGVSYIHAGIANSSSSSLSNDYWVDDIVITTLEGVGVEGDAYYLFGDDTAATLYAAGDGLQIDGATPAGIPPYNPAHIYDVEIAGTDAVLAFQYVDSDYIDNQQVSLKITVDGPNMGLTPP